MLITSAKTDMAMVRRLPPVVQASCELLLPLRLADFNIVPCPWGQSWGKTADLSNDSFLSLVISGCESEVGGCSWLLVGGCFSRALTHDTFQLLTPICELYQWASLQRLGLLLLFYIWKDMLYAVLLCSLCMWRKGMKAASMRSHSCVQTWWFGLKTNTKFPLSGPPRGGEPVWERAQGMWWRNGQGKRQRGAGRLKMCILGMLFCCA